MSTMTNLAHGSHEAQDADGRWQQVSWNADHVIVFSDCGYAGRSKGLPLGDYGSLRKVGVEHNAISSVIIPEGMAIEVFQLRGFGGHWYRLNQNQICLKGNWNNRIGSLRVVEDDPRNSYGLTDDYGEDASDRNCHSFSFRAIEGEAAIRFVDKNKKLTKVGPGRKIEGELCGQEAVRVELAKKDRKAGAILSVADQDYEFKPWAQYDDYRGNLYRKYFTIELPQHKRDQRKVKYGQNGWGDTSGFGKRFSSGVESGENWGNNYQGKWYKKAIAKTQKSSNNQANNCPAYAVSGNHPDTGIRFLVGDHKFHMIGSGTVNRKLCHSGEVTVEMAKKRKEAKVVLNIGGNTYVFREGDSGDQYQNGWYRKYYTLNLR
ncbi:MAG: hypothetical protein ACR2QW_17305 [bacterium]